MGKSEVRRIVGLEEKPHVEVAEVVKIAREEGNAIGKIGKVSELLIRMKAKMQKSCLALGAGAQPDIGKKEAKVDEQN